jgi:hypothetical protein
LSLFWVPENAKRRKLILIAFGNDTVLIDPITLQETKHESSLLTFFNAMHVSSGFDDLVDMVDYDTNNSPFKSITGYTLLDSSVFDQETNSVNNISKLQKQGWDFLQIIM